MARPSSKSVHTRLEKAWVHKMEWHSLLTDAYRLALPMRNTYDIRSRGAAKNDIVFDSTLQNSAVRLANRLQSDLVPPFQRWMRLVPGAVAVSQSSEEDLHFLQLLFDEITNRFFTAIRTSNFDTAVNEFFLDLSIGTGAMLMLEGEGDTPFEFITVPSSELALEDGAKGSISAVYRKHKVVVRNMPDEWPDLFRSKESDAKPETWDAWVADHGDDEIEVFEATYFNRESKKWLYDVILDGVADSQGLLRVVTRNYMDNPWIIARWSKTAGEVQGRGPVLFALPDAKVLNKAKELVLKNAALAIAGVWTAADDGVLNPNTVVIRPGAVIPVASNDTSRPSLSPLDFKGNFDVAQLIFNDLTMAIKKALLDDQLPPDDISPKSAFEISARIRELQQDTGSPFSRLFGEFFRPLIQRGVNILIRKGLIRLPGLSRVRVDGTGIDLDILSPLAQAQALADIDTLLTWVQLNQQATGPEMFMVNAKVEDIARITAEKLAIDPKLVRPQNERVQIKNLVDAIVQRSLQQEAAATAA